MLKISHEKIKEIKSLDFVVWKLFIEKTWLIKCIVTRRPRLS
jgi:hypothetical protein